jgi:predicted RNase H-like HicB family nuclease
MKAEFTAIIDEAPEGGYWAICPEIPGANGQGDTKEEAKESLREAIALILEDRLEDGLRGLATPITGGATPGADTADTPSTARCAPSAFAARRRT